jgi:hypothetical protein
MSDFLNDLLKAGTFLQQNVEKLQMNRTIAQANDHVQKIKSSELDEQQQRSQLQQLSQALVMDLSRFGAPAETVQQVSQAISPNRFFQTADQVLINPDLASPDQKKMAQSLYEDDQSIKRDTIQAKRDKEVAKAAATKDQRIFKAVESGQKRVDSLAKKSLEALDSASTMREMLLSNNPVADSAVPTFAARATGEVGNLTDEERKPYGGSQAIHRRLAALAKKASTGKLTDADRKDLMNLSTLFETAAQRNIRRHQEKVGKQLASNLGVSEDEVFTKLIPDYQPPGEQPVQKSMASPSRPGSPSGLVPVKVKDKSGQVIEVMKDPATGKYYRK